MLLVVCCLLFVVNGGLGVCRMLNLVSGFGILCVGSCLLCVVYCVCVFFVVQYLLSIVCCLQWVGWFCCLLFIACC